MPVKVSGVQIPLRMGVLGGQLSVPEGSDSVIIFAHGSSSSRGSHRNQFVARELNNRGFSTLLLDLLTPAEERTDVNTMHFRFDIPMLASRVVSAIDWVKEHQPDITNGLALFGVSTGAAAALIAAARRENDVSAVVARSGRPDLADRFLTLVRSPTLLIVGGRDHVVIELNRQAMVKLSCDKRLIVVPNATHVFEEKGALQRVADLATEWFSSHVRTGVLV